MVRGLSGIALAGAIVKISVKFSAAVILLLLVSLGAAAWLLIRQQNQIIYEQVQARAQTVLDFGESCREYARNTLSPAVHRQFDHQGQKAPLVFEADSATFVARGTFEALKKRSPQYSFREAALNPLNPENLADEGERRLIEQFQANPSMPDLRGFRLQGDVENFYIARPIVVETKCLACHHSPESAPQELVARYGSEHGYGWKDGEINSVLIVTVPSADIRSQQAGMRWRLLIIFAGLAILLVVAVPLLFEQLINRRLRRAGLVMEQIRGDLQEPEAASSCDGPLSPTPPADWERTPKPSSDYTPPHGVTPHRLGDHRLPVESADELGVLAATFNRMADAVRDSHQYLEDRVRRRTKDLSRSNSALEMAKRQLEENARRLTESLEKLRQSEARARAVLETALDAVVTIDHKGRVVEFNRAAEEMFGHRRDTMLGRELAELIVPPDLRESHRRGLARYLSTGEGKLIGRRVEVTALHSSGRQFPIDLALTVITDKPPLFTAIVRDITERKQKAQELAQLNTRLTAILDAATQVSIIATDPDGLITDFNSGAERMTGYTAEEMVGKQAPSIVHDTDEIDEVARELSAKYGTPVIGYKAVFIEQVRRGGHFEREWTYIRKDGSRFTGHLSVTAKHDADGRLTGYVGIAIDVTKRKEAEVMLLRAKTAAEAASQAKSDFLANMSHEIRTPMSGIMGMTELALDTELTSEQREYLQMVKTSADALLSVINDVLDFSKIEAGRLNVDSIEFRLRDTIAEVMKPLSQRAHGKGLEMSTHVAPEVPDALVGDPGRLRQILLNLVGNAIKFTESGSVTVECGMQKSEVRVADGKESDTLPSAFCLLHFLVRDTGIGIPENKLNAVFEPFVQADTSTTRKYGGTGLGLTITSRLVEMMGGRVWAESEVGKGSSFHFTVRLGLSAKPASPEKQAASDTALLPAVDSAAGRPLRILLAEDNPVNQRLAVGLLAKHGHEVVVVNDGAAAVRAVSAGTFDVVLMDVHMPEMGGFEATAAIRDMERGTGRRVPILAITARAMKGDREECLKAGMDGYLSKPVQGWQLYQAIAAIRIGAPSVPLTASAPPPPGPRSFDPATVLPRLNGDRTLLREMIAIFRQSGPKLIVQLRSALDAGDGPRVRQTVHTLKGSVCNFGAEGVLQTLQKMDDLGRAGDSAGERSALGELVSGFDRLLSDLRRWSAENY